MARALLRRTATILFVGMVAAATFLGIKARYGHFGEYYHLTVDLPRAGQLLRVGSDVRERGVVIGTVSGIDLVDRHVRLTLQIEPQYRVPETAEAWVDLKTLLGDKFVDLRFEEFAPPYVQDGDEVTGHVGPELEDVLQNGVTVFESINPDSLATIIGELAEGARGHGEDVARGLDANAELSAIFARTLEPQLRALDDFDVIFGELDDVADDLNFLADAVNEGVPVYASESAQQNLERALDELTPMLNDLGDLLIDERGAWDRMIVAGDVVLQAIAERPEGLHDLVQGLYRYVFKLGSPPPVVFDGSEMAPFANFIGGEDFAGTVASVCGALPSGVRTEIPACQGVLP